MGYSQRILGHVATVTRGIGVSDAAAGAQGLPNVDPVYTWVTLAQRVPVRIAIDRVPPGIPLVSGMTATVTVKDASSRDGRTWLARAISAVETRLSDVMERSASTAWMHSGNDDRASDDKSLPADKEKPAPTPEQLDPGLAPGVGASPKIY